MFKRKLALILALLSLFCLSAAASADVEYSIINYAMDVALLPDGSATVTEHLVYQFDGEYNGIMSLFDTDGVDGVEDFCVFADGEPVLPVDEMTYEPNTYTASTDGNLTEIRVYSPGRDDTRYFSYEYRLLGLAGRYEDAGMILRKFIGENSAVSLQNATVTVRFPESGEVRAFVHGGMDESQISFTGDSVVFGPQTISSGTSVEMRLLFPAEWIPDAPLREGDILQEALAEEQKIAEEAAQRAAFVRAAKCVFAAAYALIFFLVWLLLVRRYSLKGRLSDAPDPRRLPNWPAAFATLAVEDAADTDALSGTLVELVAQGVIRMESADGDIRFTLLNRSAGNLWPHQQKVVSWLFAGRDSFSMSALNAGDSYDLAHAFEQGYNAYCNQVAEDMAARSLRYKNDGVRICINAFIIILGTLGVGFTLLAGQANVPLGVAVALLLFFFLFLMSRVRSLTDEGERLQADALALKAAEPAQGDELTRLLPWYVALGMTEPLVTRMELLKASQDGAYESCTPPYLYLGWHYGFHSLSSSMRTTHHHNASIPDPNVSSSSHSGGGSNGGGGHGAW